MTKIKKKFPRPSRGLEAENHPAHLTVGVTLAAGRSPLVEMRRTGLNPHTFFHYLKRFVRHSKDMDTYGVYSHEMDGDMTETATLVQDIFKQILVG